MTQETQLQIDRSVLIECRRLIAGRAGRGNIDASTLLDRLDAALAGAGRREVVAQQKANDGAALRLSISETMAEATRKLVADVARAFDAAIDAAIKAEG